MSNVLFNINYCNKASNRIVFKQTGFSVFFWIVLSQEVSRHFPTYTHPHSNIRELQESSVYSLYTGRCTPSLVENLMSRERRGTNSGSSVADCIHTAIFKNIRENRVLCNANQIQGEVPTRISDLHLQQQKGNR